MGLDTSLNLTTMQNKNDALDTAGPRPQEVANKEVATVKAAVAASRPLAPPAKARRKWPLMLGLGLLAMLLVALGGAYSAYTSWRAQGLLASGLSIHGVPVGGQTRAEALHRLQQKFGRLFITFQTPERSYKLSLKELGGEPQIERVVNDAFWFGRTGELLTDATRLFAARSEGHEIALPVRWDKARLRRTMWLVATNYYVQPRNAKLEVSESGVQVTEHQMGRALNVGDTLQKLQKEYHLGRTEMAATAKELRPQVTASSLAGMDVKLGQYTTYFDSGLWGRTRNIRVASEAMQGKVLMPGEVFSFNKITGERTRSKGYRMAKMFERQPGQEEAEVVDGLAGGVCQVSSTLYNAVRKSNQKVGRHLSIVERSHHSLPVTYVPNGLDATVAWPGRDFKFRNRLPHPIYLRTVVSGSRLTVSIWGRVPYDVASITVPPTESTAESPSKPERHAQNF